MDAQMVKRENLLVDIAKSLDIDPDEVIKSQQELMNEQALQQALAQSIESGEGNQVQNAEGMVGPNARNGTNPPNGTGPIGNNGQLPL